MGHLSNQILQSEYFEIFSLKSLEVTIRVIFQKPNNLIQIQKESEYSLSFWYPLKEEPIFPLFSQCQAYHKNLPYRRINLFFKKYPLILSNYGLSGLYWTENKGPVLWNLFWLMTELWNDWLCWQRSSLTLVKRKTFPNLLAKISLKLLNPKIPSKCFKQTQLLRSLYFSRDIFQLTISHPHKTCCPCHLKKFPLIFSKERQKVIPRLKNSQNAIHLSKHSSTQKYLHLYSWLTNMFLWF